MIALLRGVSLKVWGYVAVAAAAALFVLRVWSAGRKSAQVDGLKNQLDNVKVRNETDAAIERATPGERERLRRKWERD
jgi:hypothetical protein